MIRSNLAPRALFTLTAVAGLAVAGHAYAAPGPSDDRVQSTPTTWWDVEYGISESALMSEITKHDARVTDLRVVSVSPLLFSATLVANSGAYAAAGNWWWYYGLTEAEVTQKITDNGGRLISVAPYTSGSSTLFAVVMVGNIGADARTWDWWVGSDALIRSKLPAGQRFANIQTYVDPTGARSYAAITVENTESYACSLHTGVTTSELDTVVGPRKSIVDLAADDDEGMLLSAVVCTLPEVHHVRQGASFYDSSWGDLRSQAHGSSARPLLLTKYTLHGDGPSNGQLQFVSVWRDDY